MILAINYSDKIFKKKQQFNSWTAKKIGKVDKVVEFSPSDIDAVFFEENKDILNQKRGGGNWLWKPYIISKTLCDLNEDDYLIYADAGLMYLKNVNGLISKLEESNEEIMLFDIPLIECQWTKRKVFIELDAFNDEIRYSRQILGGIMVVKKSEKSLNFINKWLQLCTNKKMLLEEKNGVDECDSFISHREDQSILSVLAKKEGIKPFNDPTDYGKFTLQYLNTGRYFLPRKNNLEHVYFLLYRKSNWFIYFIKYLIKLCLNQFILKKR